MRTFKLILKGVLLYLTIFILLLFIGSADSLMANGILVISSIIVAGLVLLCKLTISWKDLQDITGDKMDESI